MLAFRTLFLSVLILSLLNPGLGHLYRRPRYGWRRCSLQWRQNIYQRYGRSFFHSSGRPIQIVESRTVVGILNTFAQTSQTIRVINPNWSRRQATIAVNVPFDSHISSLKLEIDGRLYNGKIFTKADAAAQYASLTGKTRGRVEQHPFIVFSRTVFTFEVQGCTEAIFAITWERLIPAEFQRYRLNFPVYMHPGRVNTKISVIGNVMQPEDIDLFEIGSPQFPRPVITNTSNQNVSWTWETTARELRLNSCKNGIPYWPWYGFGHMKNSCGYKWRSRSYQSNDISRDDDRFDLPFSLSFEHIPNPLLGILPTFPSIYINQVDTCSVLSFNTRNNINTEFLPRIRSATIFIDDASGVDADYFENIKTAIKEMINVGGLDVPFNPNGDRSARGTLFDQFRIIALDPLTHTVKYWPNSADRTEFAVSTAATKLSAIAFIDTIQQRMEWNIYCLGLHRYRRCRRYQVPAKNTFTFDEFTSEFLGQLNDVITLTQNSINTATDISQSLLADLFEVWLFSNIRPLGHNYIQKRATFLQDVRTEQQSYSEIMLRTFGMPIYVFGFGPNADYDLLNKLTLQNWGTVRMAFQDTPNTTIQAQVSSFINGIGKIFGNNVTVDLISTPVSGVSKSVGEEFTLRDSGFIIPLIRDHNEFLGAVKFNFTDFPVSGGSTLNDPFLRYSMIPIGAPQVTSPVNTALLQLQITLLRELSFPILNQAHDPLQITQVIDLCRMHSFISMTTFLKAYEQEKSRATPDLVRLANLEAEVTALALSGGWVTPFTDYVVGNTQMFEVALSPSPPPPSQLNAHSSNAFHIYITKVLLILCISIFMMV